MMTLGSPMSLEVALFEVVDFLDASSIVLSSTSSTMAALDALGVASMTPVLVRSMMTPCTMVSSISLVDASSRIEASTFFIAQQLLLSDYKWHQIEW